MQTDTWQVFFDAVVTGDLDGVEAAVADGAPFNAVAGSAVHGRSHRPKKAGPPPAGPFSGGASVSGRPASQPALPACRPPRLPALHTVASQQSAASTAAPACPRLAMPLCAAPRNESGRKRRPNAGDSRACVYECVFSFINLLGLMSMGLMSMKWTACFWRRRPGNRPSALDAPRARRRKTGHRRVGALAQQRSIYKSRLPFHANTSSAETRGDLKGSARGRKPTFPGAGSHADGPVAGFL